MVEICVKEIEYLKTQKSQTLVINAYKIWAWDIFIAFQVKGASTNDFDSSVLSESGISNLKPRQVEGTLN